MPRLLEFFHRNTFTGNQSTDAVIYSAPIEIAEVEQITLQLSMYAANPITAQITATLEHTSDYTFSPGSWQSLATGMVTGVDNAVISASNPLRYLRASLTIPAGSRVMASLLGVGREM